MLYKWDCCIHADVHALTRCWKKEVYTLSKVYQQSEIYIVKNKIKDKNPCYQENETELKKQCIKLRAGKKQLPLEISKTLKLLVGG